MLGVDEREESCFSKGVDHNDRDSLAGLLEGGQHAGVVGSRVLSDHKDAIGLFKVAELDSAFPDSNGLRESHPAGFVTEIAAIRQIIGPQATGEKLVQKGGLVARSPGSIEDGFIGVGEPSEATSNFCKGLLPCDGGVVGLPFRMRMGWVSRPVCSSSKSEN